MTALCRPLAALAALFLLPGCAAVDSLDRAADQAEARSNCHTSTGEWVGGPSCTMEWSVAKTTSTTTTVVTTSTAPASSVTDD
ncbi:hypothetical protein N0B44_07830 [Roseibacterium beibuensis]|uniref:hypothetical protein n=1 Tax=[Roseibacterium] beibuensis TaxID=1193142 RepID=UPI00217EAD9C|nr:hypothetical protein [Roseibacterium beibuensis]MCS6622815.1 hypothetical protein [Roseibacterium beibuensis]